MLPRPEAKSYWVRIRKLQTPVPPRGIHVWYCDYILYQINKDSPIGLHYRIADLYVPCRSNLHRLLTGLLLDWDWHFEGDLEVTPEHAKYLEIIFTHQRDYKFWAEGLKVLREKGKEEAWKWIEEKIPLLKLRDKIGT